MLKMLTIKVIQVSFCVFAWCVELVYLVVIAFLFACFSLGVGYYATGQVKSNFRIVFVNLSLLWHCCALKYI